MLPLQIVLHNDGAEKVPGTLTEPVRPDERIHVVDVLRGSPSQESWSATSRFWRG